MAQEANRFRISWSRADRGTKVRPKSRTFPVDSVVTIGRDSQSDIVLGEDKVSRSHARLVLGKDAVQVEDMDSGNGTLLGGERIKKAVWHPGISLEIGGYLLRLEAVQRSASVPKQPEAPRRVPVALWVGALLIIV